MIRRNEQLDLIDRTPLGLWGSQKPRDVPETTYAKQVTPPHGACPMRFLAGWALPCPMLGTGCKSAECETIPPPCLKCGKPAKILTKGRAAVFCSSRCRDASQADLERWSNRLARTTLVGDTAPDLFGEV